MSMLAAFNAVQQQNEGVRHMVVIRQAIGTDMTLEQATDTMVGLLRQGNTAAHQIGTLYNYVVDRKLPELAGYKTAQDYFSKRVKAVSQSTLTVYGAVARSFTEAVCTQYGVYGLRALLRYVEATGTVLGPDPSTVMIDVPQEDGKVVTKTFAECSVDEVERATRAKKAPPGCGCPCRTRRGSCSSRTASSGTSTGWRESASPRATRAARRSSACRTCRCRRWRGS